MSDVSRTPACRPDLRALFTRTYGQERTFIQSLVRRHGVPLGDVEDVVQEVFVVLHTRLPELQAETALRFWLRSVAVRVCSNHRRKLAVGLRRGALAEPIDPDTLHDVARSSPDEAFALSELRRALMRAVERLDGTKKEVLMLTALEERTAREIAELTKTPSNTVSSRLRAARKTLANIVGTGPGGSFWV
jgi:RNA polymerase sigma-70 factor, ECF subfamily